MNRHIIPAVILTSTLALTLTACFPRIPTTVVQSGDQSSNAADPSPEQAAPAQGTRDNPYPLGSKIISPEWEVTVNSFTPDGTAQVLAENQFNEQPDAGMVYSLINYTVTYVGADSDYALSVQVDFVGDDGVVYNTGSKLVVGPNQIGLDELFAGGTVTGNATIQIPAAATGAIRVRPGIIADAVFVATS